MPPPLFGARSGRHARSGCGPAGRHQRPGPWARRVYPSARGKDGKHDAQRRNAQDHRPKRRTEGPESPGQACPQAAGTSRSVVTTVPPVPPPTDETWKRFTDETTCADEIPEAIWTWTDMWVPPWPLETAVAVAVKGEARGRSDGGGEMGVVGGQEGEFDPGRAAPAPPPLSDAPAQSKGDVTEKGAGAAVASMAADDRLYASHQLFESEGLSDIIVGAKLQARDAVADGCFGADADQRGIGFGAECLEQLGPVVVGQHEIEEDDIGIPLTYELQAAVGRVDRTYRVALVAKAGRDRPGEPAVILDEGDLPSDRHLLLGRHSPTERA